MSNTITTVDQLKRAIVIAAQIEKLQAELTEILGGTISTPKAKTPKRGKRTMSPEARAKIAAAQKARWATAKPVPAPTAAVIEKIAKIEAAALKPALAKPKAPKAGPGKSIPLSELKTLLEAAPEKTLNIRKEGLQLRNIKVLAEANPQLLKLGGQNPWPSVTMMK